MMRRGRMLTVAGAPKSCSWLTVIAVCCAWGFAHAAGPVSDWDACQGDTPVQIALQQRLEACNRTLTRPNLTKGSIAWATAWRGRIQHSLKQPDPALKDFNKALQLDPDLFIALMSRAVLFLESKPELAIRDLQRIREKTPTAQVSDLLALAFENAGQLDDAHQEYARWIAIRWPNQLALYQRAGFYARNDRLGDAVRDLEQIYELDKDAAHKKGGALAVASTNALCYRAWVFYLQGDKEKACASARELVSTTERPHSWNVNPFHTQRAWHLSGNCQHTHALCLAERPELDQLAQHLQNLSIDVNNPSDETPQTLFEFAYAQALEKAGNTSEAGRIYRKLVVAKPTFWDEKRYIAIARDRLAALGSSGPALPDSTSSRLDPRLARCLAAGDARSIETACTEFLDTGLGEGADRTKAYLARAAVRQQRGDEVGALDDYNTAIELQPLTSVAYHDRGVLRSRRQDYDAAIADFEKAIELDPNSIASLQNLGITYFLSDRFEQAATAFDLAVAKGAVTYPVVYAHVSRLRLRKADVPRLEREAAQMPKDGWPRRLAAHHLGTMPLAVLTVAATTAEQTCEATYHAAERELGRNNRPKALEYFRRAKETCPSETVERRAATNFLARNN